MRPNAEALAQQLYLVSLALEQAILAEAWEETEALLISRASLIEKLSGVPAAGRAREILALVQEHEAKLVNAAQSLKREAGHDAAAFTLAQKAVQAYLAA